MNKTNFHTKGFALGLALKQRQKATGKSPICLIFRTTSCSISRHWNLWKAVKPSCDQRCALQRSRGWSCWWTWRGSRMVSRWWWRCRQLWTCYWNYVKLDIPNTCATTPCWYYVTSAFTAPANLSSWPMVSAVELSTKSSLTSTHPFTYQSEFDWNQETAKS